MKVGMTSEVMSQRDVGRGHVGLQIILSWPRAQSANKTQLKLAANLVAGLNPRECLQVKLVNAYAQLIPKNFMEWANS